MVSVVPRFGGMGVFEVGLELSSRRVVVGCALTSVGQQGAAREASGASSSLQASLGVEEVVNYLRLAGCQVSELRYRGSYRDLARNGCLKICYRARAPSLVPTSTSTDGPLMPSVHWRARWKDPASRHRQALRCPAQWARWAMLRLPTLYCRCWSWQIQWA